MTSSWQSRWPPLAYTLHEQSVLSLSSPQPVIACTKLRRGGGGGGEWAAGGVGRGAAREEEMSGRVCAKGKGGAAKAAGIAQQRNSPNPPSHPHSLCLALKIERCRLTP